MLVCYTFVTLPPAICCPVLGLYVVAGCVLIDGMQHGVPYADLTPLLPEFSLPATPDSVAQYARACLAVLGLVGWAFGWDRTVRRLGGCHYKKKRLSLSVYFAEKFCTQQPELVRRTVLHELAHALAATHFGDMRHGAAWRQCCAALGIAGEKATCRCEDFSPHVRPYRYALCHRQTGEVFRYYKTRPRLSAERLQHAYIPGRKAETLGFLCITPLP